MKRRWLTEHEAIYPTVTLEVVAQDEPSEGGAQPRIRDWVAG